MADDLKQTGRQDDERINPEQDHEQELATAIGDLARRHSGGAG